MHSVETGSAVGAPRDHGTLADLPARPVAGRLPPVDPVRSPLRPARVLLGRCEDPDGNGGVAGWTARSAALADSPGMRRGGRGGTAARRSRRGTPAGTTRRNDHRTPRFGRR